MSLDPRVSNPEKRWVGRSFGAAAGSYDGVAVLQKEVGERLMHRLAARFHAPEVIVDVGAGTGYFATGLLERYPGSHLVALDIAEGMLLAARSRIGRSPNRCCVGGDAEALPLADRSVDLVFSNLAIQWCPGLAGVFGEFRRVLKPQGVALFSTFGAGTLVELRRAWAAVDDRSHVNDFADLAGIAGALSEAGFANADIDGETRCLEYGDVHALMREIKDLGAHNVTYGRPRHLTGKARLRRMIDAYAAQMAGGGVRASFEVVYGVARKE